MNVWFCWRKQYTLQWQITITCFQWLLSWCCINREKGLSLENNLPTFFVSEYIRAVQLNAPVISERCPDDDWGFHSKRRRVIFELKLVTENLLSNYNTPATTSSLPWDNSWPTSRSPQHIWWGLVLAEMYLTQWVTYCITSTLPLYIDVWYKGKMHM